MHYSRIIVRRYGGPEVLERVNEPLRLPQPGEVRIKVQAAGVALADVMRREGVFPESPTPPFVPGYDVVGIVDETGERVQSYGKGDRIGVLSNGTGGYSEVLYASEEQLIRVPDSVDAAQASAVMLNYVSAYQMLHRLAAVKKGNSVLIHGASGGVGTALLELGQALKLTMYGTASASKHRIVSQYGAIPIDYRSDDFVNTIRRLEPAGVDAVFDPIGGGNWHRSFQTLNRNGRFIGYGFTSALCDPTDKQWMDDWKTVTETGATPKGHPAFIYSITSLRKDKPDWFQQDAAILFSMLEKGEIKPLISHRVPFAEAASAQQLLKNSESAGKVVLISS
ncbi:medium chain dehydrogenase/reductase family protein [Paenibacillus thermotolerans]|uniref:medium chain dehydrogenase/reductase family protein n=1 Tax=Paenibacillus thermotolerans TaxID=3027807 RepID=UPI0023677DC5|nr:MULTISPECIES: medium chain dehydrogenase/reductase family protein [unclassified Paenibacillus]